MQTFDEFLTEILGVLPDAEVGEDNDGQIVVYTNRFVSHDDIVHEFDKRGEHDNA